MLSYPVILKALKITCYVKHIKCPATPPSPNTLQIITFIIPHLSSHQYISLPLLWLQPWWVWYPFHLLLLAHIFTAAPQTMAHYSHKLGITPQLASQEFCRQHCPVASLCKLHCHFLAVQWKISCFPQKFWSPAMASVARSRGNIQAWSTEIAMSHLHYLERNISNMVISTTQYRADVNTLYLS